MKLFPAIDIKDGKCVRLKQGLFNDVTVYSEEPYKVAVEFEKCGADYIHLVDLDGSLKGRSVNAETIKKIVESVNIPVELGGGIRTIENIRETLALGVDRVIIGTKAVENPEFVKEAVETFGAEKIVAGIDAKDGFVAINGWEELSDKTALSLCLKMKEMGVKTVIYTDISKDGMLVGPNFEKTKELSDATGLDIVASGGMSCIEDLKKLDELNIYGAIMGKAIYEKKIDLSEAVKMFGSKKNKKVEKIIPVMYIKDGSAYKDIKATDAFDGDPVTVAASYSDNGADEIMIYDLSYDDASHDANIGLVRAIANTVDVPLLVGGNVKRTEDVKKYLYAGAKCAFLQASKEANVVLIKEVADRFGKKKILLLNDTYDKDAIEVAENEQIGGIISFDEVATSLEVIKPYTDCTFDIMQLKAKLKAEGKCVNTFESKVAFSDFKLNSDGMIPVIVQDYKTDEVLMLAYMNEEAFNLTVETGRMTYFSRSRNEIWVKGLTSGHFQYVMSMEIDCDKDTLLAKVRQIGAACHTGNRSCFYTNLMAREYANTNPLKVFNEVMGTILDRKEHPKEGSYTNYLFDKGIDKILKKVGEEATEIVIAAKNPDKEEIKYEVADFLYHVMVLMALRDVTWEEIITELARR